MRDDFKKKSYISEDEGAGYAAPIIDLISSSAILILSFWIIYESLKLKIPDNNILTAPALLPVIISISLIFMTLGIFYKSLKKLSINKTKIKQRQLERTVLGEAIAKEKKLFYYFIPQSCCTQQGCSRTHAANHLSFKCPHLLLRHARFTRLASSTMVVLLHPRPPGHFPYILFAILPPEVGFSQHLHPGVSPGKS